MAANDIWKLGPTTSCGETARTAIQASLGKAGADADLPEPMGAIRESDVQGIEVIAPGAELIPAEGRAWTVEEDGDGFDIEYEGGGIHVTAGASGSLLTVIDGVPSEAIEIDGPGLYTVAEHDRHGAHRIEIELVGSPEIWSVSFSPAPA